jgi:DNA-binding NtrC family response regulator
MTNINPIFFSKEGPIVLRQTVVAAAPIGIKAFLMKPFVKQELSGTIGRVLDGKREE